MKILVLSDTHGNLTNARIVLKKLEDKIQMVFHLGDLVKDAERLMAEFPALPFNIVSGNNDRGENANFYELVSLMGCRLLLTHGHRHQVHWNYDTINYWAEEKEADIVIFGHSHSTVNDAKGRIMLFNPGSISQPRDGAYPTFGILDIQENGFINGSIMECHRKEDFRIRSAAKGSFLV